MTSWHLLQHDKTDHDNPQWIWQEPLNSENLNANLINTKKERKKESWLLTRGPGSDEINSKGYSSFRQKACRVRLSRTDDEGRGGQCRSGKLWTVHQWVLARVEISSGESDISCPNLVWRWLAELWHSLLYGTETGCRSCDVQLQLLTVLY